MTTNRAGGILRGGRVSFDTKGIRKTAPAKGANMIVKEKTSPPPADKYGRAGHDAEIQMAFYLRRAFAEAPDVFVFNDLRLERNGESAQMDHLVMHRFGFVIVESKSVVGKLVVNSQGEFTRIWSGRPRGIQSPIQQARLQAELLRQLLNDHKELLRRKVFFGLKQGEFGYERFRVQVAVSDDGIIKREGIDPPELRKADSVAEAIRQIIKTHADASGVSGFLKVVTSDRKTSAQIEENHLPAYTDEEMLSIKEFLLTRNVPSPPPIARRALTPAPPPVRPVQPSPRVALLEKATTPTTRPPDSQGVSCKHCKADKLAIVYGRYGYYYKCQECQGNTPIDQTCTACGMKARVSKSGLEFRRICKACGADEPFHSNAPELEGPSS